MTASIRKSAEAMLPKLIEFRRDFHRHPEIGFQEARTAKVIAERLETLGWEVKTGVAKTGVVGLWPGSDRKGKTLAFRADMDALPIQEKNDHAFVSQNPGMMHACGHDGHMAMALGLAEWIANRKEPFPGNIKLIFQPGEEGFGGAKRMIDDGVLKDPAVDAIIALHIWNDGDAGSVGIVEGPSMASIDGFQIEVLGKGGHSAMPHQTVDAVLVASQINVAMQSIVSRSIDPLTPAVISVTRILAENADNAIAERATLRGTARTFDKDLRAQFPFLIERCAKGVAEAMGAEIDFTWTELYPPTISDSGMAKMVQAAASDVQERQVSMADERTLASEDMAFFLEKVPGCFFFLGSRNPEKGLDNPHHNPRFDFEESVMALGLAVLARAAERFFEAD
jgi:amidohydrolase